MHRLPLPLLLSRSLLLPFLLPLIKTACRPTQLPSSLPLLIPLPAPPLSHSYSSIREGEGVRGEGDQDRQKGIKREEEGGVVL